eukprot:m.167104 g.167104  ORF g.167104 m.167104 type:complete len:112 (+) comp14720_c1_seq3:3367-3702(+)
MRQCASGTLASSSSSFIFRVANRPRPRAPTPTDTPLNITLCCAPSLRNRWSVAGSICTEGSQVAARGGPAGEALAPKLAAITAAPLPTAAMPALTWSRLKGQKYSELEFSA